MSIQSTEIEFYYAPEVLFFGIDAIRKSFKFDFEDDFPIEEYVDLLWLLCGYQFPSNTGGSRIEYVMSADLSRRCPEEFIEFYKHTSLIQKTMVEGVLKRIFGLIGGSKKLDHLMRAPSFDRLFRNLSLDPSLRRMAGVLFDHHVRSMVEDFWISDLRNANHLFCSCLHFDTFRPSSRRVDSRLTLVGGNPVLGVKTESLWIDFGRRRNRNVTALNRNLGRRQGLMVKTSADGKDINQKLARSFVLERIESKLRKNEVSRGSRTVHGHLILGCPSFRMVHEHEISHIPGDWNEDIDLFEFFSGGYAEEVRKMVNPMMVIRVKDDSGVGEIARILKNGDGGWSVLSIPKSTIPKPLSDDLGGWRFERIR